MESILKNNLPISETQKPLCPVFGECGGCLYQNISYSDELAIKENRLKELFKKFDSALDDKIDPIIASPKPYHYRNRLDLKLKRTRNNDVFIGFTPIDNKSVIAVDACYIADEQISHFIPELKRQAIDRLTPKYRNANLTVRVGGDDRVLWGGIGRKSCELPVNDYFWIELEGKRIFYSLDTFFQTNSSILPKLFEVIKSFSVWSTQPILYDLYGGVGLFSVGLNECAKKVILIEENMSSLNVARHNIAHNQLNNVTIIDGRVEEHLQNCLTAQKDKCKVALIDPPRAGLSQQACQLLSESKELQHVLYLSCNPESLIDDLDVFMQKGWRIQKIIPFDFFPKTKHLETLVLLKL